MAISRKTKERLVEEYKEKVADARGLILTGFKGLSVRGAEGLRASVREVGGEFQVVKNSLIQLALQDAGIELPQDALEGTTAVGFATTDIPGVAKAMVDLEKDEQVLQIKAAYVEGRWVQPAQIIRLAELPPLPILQAQLLGLIKTPSRMVASVLASSVRQVVNVVKAYADSGGSRNRNRNRSRTRGRG